MEVKNLFRMNGRTLNTLGVGGLVCLLPVVLFLLSFQLKAVGIEFPLRAFYWFDRFLFDIGDFVIAVCLPFAVVATSVATLLLRKERNKLLIFVMIAALFLLAVNVTVYAIVDPIFEARGLSIYGF